LSTVKEIGSIGVSPVAPSAGVEVIEATGGTTIVVDGAALDDELGSLLAPLLWLSGAPLAVDVTVAVVSDPPLHPANNRQATSAPSNTVTGALLRAALIVITALSQLFPRGGNTLAPRQPIHSGQRQG
jgi:hypothetical protein